RSWRRPAARPGCHRTRGGNRQPRYSRFKQTCSERLRTGDTEDRHTPIAPLAVPEPRVAPRRVAPDVVAAALPGAARDRLAAGEVLVVTTGQQPGLFTGPLYTVYKALS